MAARSLERTMLGLSTMELSRTQVAQELETTRAVLLAQGRDMEATQVEKAMESVSKGADSQAGKALMATLYGLDSGKKKSEPELEGEKPGGEPKEGS
jgi:hypothetical protein